MTSLNKKLSSSFTTLMKVLKQKNICNVIRQSWACREYCSRCANIPEFRFSTSYFNRIGPIIINASYNLELKIYFSRILTFRKGASLETAHIILVINDPFCVLWLHFRIFRGNVKIKLDKINMD